MELNVIILEAIAQGDRNAFQRLYAAVSDRVYNTALGYLQNEKDAEEVTQDVFLKVWKSAGNFKGDAAPETWIYRITVNTSLNAIRKRKRHLHDGLDEAERDRPDFEHPGILMERREDAGYLFQVIKELPEAQKTAFILSYLEDLPRQKVADIMEVSLKAVESLLQRGKANLRKKLINMHPHRRKK